MDLWSAHAYQCQGAASLVSLLLALARKERTWIG